MLILSESLNFFSGNGLTPKYSVENIKKLMKLCMKFKHNVIFNSDCHISFDVGDFSNCIKHAKINKFNMNLVVNDDLEKLIKHITKK